MAIALYVAISVVTALVAVMVMVAVLTLRTPAATVNPPPLGVHSAAVPRSPSRPPVVTTIVVTAPHPAIPSTDICMDTLQSLVTHAPELTTSPHRVVVTCDGARVEGDGSHLDGRCRTPIDIATYAEYVARLRRDVAALLPHARVVTAPNDARGCLTTTLKRAMDTWALPPDVTHVNVMQHDLPLVRRLPVTALLDVMSRLPNTVQMVRYALGSPRGHLEHARIHCKRADALRVSTLTDAATGLTLTQSTMWSDNNHLASLDHYARRVWPAAPPGTFMEHRIMCRPLEDAWAEWGTWTLGGMDEPSYLRHTDGRNAQPRAV